MGDQAVESSKKRKRRKRNKGAFADASEEHDNDSGAADNSEEVAVKEEPNKSAEVAVIDEPNNYGAADDGNDDAADEDEPTKKRKRKRNRKSKPATPDDKPDNTTLTSLNTTDTTTYTVFIEGLPFTSTPSDVRTFFESHGCSDILEMRLPTWQDSGRLRGFGHIVFGSLKTKERALSEVNRKELGGRYVSVLEAKAPRAGTTAGSGIAGKVREQPEGCNTVFVRNLPYEANEEDILESFRVCGKILDGGVRIARNHNGQSKGFGYVEYKTTDGAYQAVQKAAKPFGLKVGGRPVFVDYDEGSVKGSFRGKDGKLWSKEFGDRNGKGKAAGRGHR